MLKVDVRVKTCQVCQKEITLREALEVAAGIDDYATIEKLQLVCKDKENEATKITELDILDDDADITAKVFYPVTLAFTDTPVVCRECLGIHEPTIEEKAMHHVMDMVIGDYLATYMSSDCTPDEDKEQMATGIKEICKRLGIKYRLYDVDQLLG